MTSQYLRFPFTSLFIWLAAGLLVPTAARAADLVSVTAINQTASAQSAVPVTFGQVFKAGEVPAGTDIGARLASGTVLSTQVDRKATHADGSLRHAILTVKLPGLAANGSEIITLFTKTATAAGSAVQVSDLLAAGFNASVSLNVGGTVYSLSAADLLAANPRQWLAGPQVSEWIVGGPVKTSGGSAHPHLAAYFHVRAYAGAPISRARVDVSIENGWTFVASPADSTYDVTVTVGGQNVYSRAGLTHYHHARWHKTFWWGADPAVFVKHDTRYLRDSKAVPNYGEVTLAESFLNGLRSATEPMDNGDHSDYMPATGYANGIGLLPLWDALYAVSADPRAFKAMLANSDGAGAYGAHYRDEATGRPVSIADHPTATTQNTTVPKGTGSNPYTHDQAHQPSMAYLAYLATGDYYYLEELQFWATWNFLWANASTYRQYDKGIFGVQVRGQAWALRTLGQVAYITPDTDPLKAHFIASIGYNMAHNEGLYANNPSANKLGALPSYDGYTQFKPWMDDFYTASLGYLVDLGFTEAVTMRNWKATQPVGRMGTTDYCYLKAGSYVLTVGTSNTDWFPDFATLYQQNFGANTSCPEGGTMDGYASESGGYVANLRPALATAVDAGTPGAVQAWNRMVTSAVQPDFTNNPIWNVVPRASTAGLPTVTLAASPTSITSGGTSTLTWTSANATSCTASGSSAFTGAKATSGSESVNPTSTTTYTLICTGAGGSASSSATVTVTAASGSSATSSTGGGGSLGWLSLLGLVFARLVSSRSLSQRRLAGMVNGDGRLSRNRSVQQS